MANASGKRIAQSNEQKLKQFRIGLIVCNLLTFLFRYVTRKPLIPSFGCLFLYITTFIISIAIYSHFASIGTPRRDGKGNLLASGEDLNGGGLIEWGWDTVYTTWLCSILSSLFGPKSWYLYLFVPGVGIFKLWTTFGPIIKQVLGIGAGGAGGSEGGAGGPGVGAAGAAGAAAAAGEGEMKESKRQQKLRARMEKGDKRVKQVERKM